VQTKEIFRIAEFVSFFVIISSSINVVVVVVVAAVIPVVRRRMKSAIGTRQGWIEVGIAIARKILDRAAPCFKRDGDFSFSIDVSVTDVAKPLLSQSNVVFVLV